MLSGMAGGVADPLLAELERARTGEMRDIVATIQAEQDVVDPRAVSTSASWCREARAREDRGRPAPRRVPPVRAPRGARPTRGVLVVGPNPVFLRYISQVLPSLGETSVVQTTVPGLRGASFPVRAVEPAGVAKVKGDARMADVVQNACRAGLRRPTDDIVVATRWGPVRLTPDALGAAMDDALALGRAWQLDRDAFRGSLIGLLMEGLRAPPTRCPRDA